MRVAPQLVLLITALSLASLCQAETSGGQDQPADLDQLKQIVENQGKQLKEQQKQIEKLQMGSGVNDNSLNIRGLGDPSQGQAPADESSDNEKKKGGQKPPEAQGQLPTQPVGRPPEKAATANEYKEIEAIFRQQGVLTPKNTLIVEPSFQYQFSSSNQVVLGGYTVIPALTVGLINTEKVQHNSYVPGLAARYGLTDRLEMQFYAPYYVRQDSTVFTAQQQANVQPIFNTKGSNIGDIQFGLRYQFNMPTSGGPIFIGGLLAKSDTGQDPFTLPSDTTTGTPLKLATGTGFWGIYPSLSVILPSDPVVFFGSVNYLYQFRANYPVGGVSTEIVPGGTFGFNFGIGYSLNEKASLSMGYEHYIIFPTDIVSTTATLSPLATQSVTLGSLVFGAAYRVTDNFSVNFSLEAGITADAPDITMTIRFPFNI
jgi:hypothetical protein